MMNAIFPPVLFNKSHKSQGLATWKLPKYCVWNAQKKGACQDSAQTSLQLELPLAQLISYPGVSSCLNPGAT